MPAVHYYLGRPAAALIAAMSPRGSAQATATATGPAAGSPARPRAATPAGRPRVPAEGSAPRITATAESAWAAHWFTAPGAGAAQIRANAD
jgi:hypothetical protein